MFPTTTPGLGQHDPRDVLYERELTELDVCIQNIELFRKYIHDYECVKERLSTLADKTNHDIMVPIAGSKLAFMPGHIHHTNEVLVLIGDNYFVEKSTKEAVEFVERRISFCQEKIHELEAQRNMLQNWIDATSEAKGDGGLVDIAETCSEEELEKWKLEHRKRVEEYKMSSMQKSADIDVNQILAKYEKEESKLIDGENEQPQTTQVLPKNPIEEEPISIQNLKERDANIPELIPSEPGGERPISKFKASRMKR